MRSGICNVSLAALLLVLLQVGNAGAGEPAGVVQDPPGDSKVHTSTARYTVPDIELIRDDGKHISLPKEMNDGRPVMLNFIFTSCGSVCPLMSQIFSQVQHRLGRDARGLHLMSISIDPEQDTPARLREYADRFDAGPGWHHYTGTVAASLTAQRAFDVYRGDKMSHSAVTLLRSAPGQPWRRIDGFVNPDRLLYEYRMLLASR